MAGDDRLHIASTFYMDSCIRTGAEIIGDTELLVRLSVGDMVVQEAQYHKKCSLALYNPTRDAKQDKDDECMTSGIAFAELVMYIE